MNFGSSTCAVTSSRAEEGEGDEYYGPNRNLYDNRMKEGDIVIVYLSHDSLDYIILAKDLIYDNKYGNFYHNDFLGRQFGSKVFSRSTSGWIHALRPTAELWAEAQHSRTQIVNFLDSSVVICRLDIHPGCRVVESGTGSGAMTMSLARAVSGDPQGHVYTYEYNQSRADAVREEFASLGLNNGLITVTCADVCGKQYGQGGFDGVQDRSIDAVFLDLPEPWLALEHAKRVLKPGKGLCCYSPCMEQVTKTCEVLRESGFHSVRMIEARQRPFDGRLVHMEVADLGTTPKNVIELPSASSVDFSDSAIVDGTDTPPTAESVREAVDQLSNSISDNSSNNSINNGSNNSSSKNDNSGDSSGDICLDGKKRKFPSVDNGSNEVDCNGDLKEGNDDHDPGAEAVDFEKRRRRVIQAPIPPHSILVARPENRMKGHTAYLTFALSPIEA